ncbi:unnamed protein product [Blepharisma stoltei]|uniref:Uncharacterized protein n=1 Tax=Blepharisma stoltei TaxID=1481888 RepID=A0AAU9JQS1_9CILI|nr:unnamed protein product [Blepharisma stoltei]
MIFFFLIALIKGQILIQDGETVDGSQSSIIGGTQIYKFHVSGVADTDLALTLTTFSDWGSPSLLVSQGHHPNLDDYDWKSATWGIGSIVIPSSELSENTDYYIKASCFTYCRYSLTVSHVSEIVLTPGVPLSGILSKGKQQIYNFLTPIAIPPQLSIEISLISGNIKLFVSKNGQEPSTSNNLPTSALWYFGETFIDPSPSPSTLYKAAVIALEDSQFSIILNLNQTETISLKASATSYGIVNHSDFKYYSIYVDDENEDLSVVMTQFSGEAEIYIKAGQIPSKKDYDYYSAGAGNYSLVITGSQRKSINKAVGYYYIGIYGISTSAYGIAASINQDSVISLFSGIPMTCYADPDAISLHHIDLVSNFSYNISIYLTALSGNPDLYAKLCLSSSIKLCQFSQEELNSPSIFSSKNQIGNDYIFINHQSGFCSANNPCRYIIGVKGNSSLKSDYTILATLDSTKEQFLQEGRPLFMSTLGNEYKYFKYSVFNATTIQVEFILTPITGDPNLFSSKISKPSINNYEKYSGNYGTMIESIKYVKGLTEDSLVGEYHISVYSPLSSFFSIVAKESTPDENTKILLYPGHPQRDTLYNTTDVRYRLYYFPVHFPKDDKKAIKISLIPITGKFTIYVGTRLEINLGSLISPDGVIYYNGTLPFSTITISPSDILYKCDTTYGVYVRGDEFSYDNSSDYSIVVSFGDDGIILSDDIPFTDAVTQQAENFYVYQIHEDHPEITISVTALTGDPDLMIYAKSNHENIIEASRYFGSDAISFYYDNVKWLCGETSAVCLIYIGVSGALDSTYTIRASSKQNMPKYLVSNIPEIGYLNSFKYSCYYYSLSTSMPLLISTQSSKGSISFNINLTDADTLAVSNVSFWMTFPSFPNQYSSWSSTPFLNEIRMNEAQLPSHCPSGNCIALIGVRCYDLEYCQYTIEANQNLIYTLLEGEPKYSFIYSDQFAYFSYYCDKDDANLIFTLTDLSNEDLDLYINKGKEKRPSLENSIWNSNGWGGDTVVISADDKYFKEKNVTMKGYYTVGVYGLSLSSFSLTASSNFHGVTRLAEGKPNYGFLLQNSANYYYFENFSKNNITIQITPTTGNPILYVNPESRDDSLYSKLPSSSSYVWSSISSNNRYSIKISENDPGLCKFCTLVISVASNNSNCSYSIIATTTSSLILLQNGVQFNSWISSLEYQFLYFQVISKADIDISFTLFSGKGNLYINTDENVDKNSYLWTSNEDSQIKHIHIRENDPNLKIGLYYIAIYGEEDISYSIIATMRNSYINLIDGWPQTYSLEYNSQDKLYFTYRDTGGLPRPVLCNLRSYTPDFQPTVYAYIEGNSNASPSDFPSEKKYDQSYDSSNYYWMTNSLDFYFYPNLLNAKVNLAVYGISNQNKSASDLGEFELVCSSSMEYLVLKEGDAVLGSFWNDIKSHRYEIIVNLKGKLEIFVKPCEGSVKLEISSNWTVLSQSEPDIEIARITDGKITGIINNAIGKYYITVSQLNSTTTTEAASYQIYARLRKPGQPKEVNIVPGNDGIISAHKIGNKLNLTWEAPMYENGEKLKNLNEIYYKIFFTPDDHEEKSTYCGTYYPCRYDNGENIGNTENGKTYYMIDLEDYNGVINILAILPASESSEWYNNWSMNTIAYNPISVSHEAAWTQSWIGKVLIWGVIIIFTFSFVSAFIFYKKYKRSQRKLEIEMADIRNIASTELEAKNEPKNYDPLHEEK